MIVSLNYLINPTILCTSTTKTTTIFMVFTMDSKLVFTQNQSQAQNQNSWMIKAIVLQFPLKNKKRHIIYAYTTKLPT